MFVIVSVPSSISVEFEFEIELGVFFVRAVDCVEGVLFAFSVSFSLFSPSGVPFVCERDDVCSCVCVVCFSSFFTFGFFPSPFSLSLWCFFVPFTFAGLAMLSVLFLFVFF